MVTPDELPKLREAYEALQQENAQLMRQRDHWIQARRETWEAGELIRADRDRLAGENAAMRRSLEGDGKTYPGTRQDWIDRAFHAEGDVERWKQRDLEAAGYLTKAFTDIDILRAAAQALVEKLALCQPAIDSAFLMGQVHGAKYSGPTYGDELAALKSLLEA